MSKHDEKAGYERIDSHNPQNIEALSKHYREILSLIGEDPEREGLIDTPVRVAKAIQFLTQGNIHAGPAPVLPVNGSAGI